MDQKSLVFTPHVLPVLKGTTVNFLNSDSVAHNVFSPDKIADKMDLGTWQKGRVRNYTFNELGYVNLLCNLHPEMSAYILVLQNPYFAMAQSDGRFLIEDVPGGDYILTAWHESKKIQSKDITVADDDNTYVEFIFD